MHVRYWLGLYLGYCLRERDVLFKCILGCVQVYVRFCSGACQALRMCILSCV